MNRNTRTLLGLGAVIGGMLALTAAAVPLYDMFCRVTGYGGTPQTATETTGVILDETIRIHFDANSVSSMNWTFRPMQREMTVRIGEEALAFYEAVNNSDQPVTGRAIYNVSPDITGYYFDKIECFCFTEQTLQPGERVEMPISFFVDPDMVTDPDAGHIRDITLSYTFHPAEPTGDRAQAALDLGTKSSVN